jgi:hypothetical protein
MKCIFLLEITCESKEIRDGRMNEKQYVPDLTPNNLKYMGILDESAFL